MSTSSAPRTRLLAHGALFVSLCALPSGCDRVGELLGRDASGAAPIAEAPKDPATPAAVAPTPTAPVAAAAAVNAESPPAIDVPIARGEEAAAGDGRFVWRYRPAKTATYKPYEALFEHARLPAVVAMMGMFALPRNVPVATLECGQPNAFYNSDKHGIVMCYELAHEFYTRFRAESPDDQVASDRTLNALTFVLLHEMGHGLLGELEIGVTGGEEDAVDDLATLMLLDAKQPAWAVDGAASMAMLGAGAKPKFFGEHSLGEQRFFNIACIVYGSDPARFVGLVTQGVLPQQRAVRCGKEYATKDKAWSAMLGPHTRDKQPRTP
jgi:hypothetical protein